MAAQRYFAFLSYSHADQKEASWLHRALEHYRLPKGLVGRASPIGPIPPRPRPVFRDRDELAAATSLGDRLVEALAASSSLIVLCSPSAAASKWTNEEIATFKRNHPERPILAAIVAGEPFASQMPGREAEECFPPALRYELEPDGSLSDRPAEPIAADLRPGADGKRLAKLKLIAGILDVRLDELVQRDAARRNRRLGALAAASLVGMVGTSSLALYALDQRDAAREQRSEADGLIEYMLVDLRKQLEPVGRLELLDGVGNRAMAYYARQDIADLTDNELGRRARATQLVAEVQNLRGNNQAALPAFKQSARTTAAILARNPSDTEALFNHSQSQFWVGYLAWQSDDLDEAQRRFTDYRQLAGQLLRVEPDNATWRAEWGHANTNLGVVAIDREALEEARAYFKEAEATWRTLGGESNAAGAREMSFYLAQSLAWQSQIDADLGRIAEALDLRQRESAIYARLGKADEDFQALQGLVVSRANIARFHLDLGDVAAARAVAEDTMRAAERLGAQDEGNAFWKEIRAKAAIRAGETHLLGGALAEARRYSTRALGLCEALVAGDDSVGQWKSDCLAPALAQLALVAHREGRGEEAATLAARFAALRGNAELPDSDSLAIASATLAAIGLAPLSRLDGEDHRNDARLSALYARLGHKTREIGDYPVDRLLGS
ncbi:toll/interleukin-1 receptor domain-containing protein [Sphingomicrobium arenosum]|uniref:toll/interleukin-1 receptor domain-containing protein n=1 Tax=Sphingomicrobium arenosum TaxID=2233861 RepID=UPI0022408B11|nr:toll/interleukin-1 receptor domain-containing protein [Sphingomicrobium arenosum]